MIADALLNFAFNVVSWIIGLLPTSTGFPADVFTAFSTIGGYTQILDPIIPWSTIATTVGLAFATEIDIFGSKTFKWLLSHIPCIGGNGVSRYGALRNTTSAGGKGEVALIRRKAAVYLRTKS